MPRAIGSPAGPIDFQKVLACSAKVCLSSARKRLSLVGPDRPVVFLASALLLPRGDCNEKYVADRRVF
jgi:hypothetical protein